MLRQWNFEIDLEVDNKRVPVYKQLAEQIQQMIESGILKNGDLLPGGREIAQKLNVSRKTVLSAMELLVFSGWLENRERVGLFVRNPQPYPNKAAQHVGVASTLSHDPVEVVPAATLMINDGYPDTKILPFKELSSAFRQLFNQAARWHMLGYSDPLGNVKLRTALSQGICHERGLQACIEQLMLTRGSQQALYLVAHVLLHPGDAVVVEDPGYLNARRILSREGFASCPCRSMRRVFRRRSLVNCWQVSRASVPSILRLAISIRPRSRSRQPVAGKWSNWSTPTISWS